MKRLLLTLSLIMFMSVSESHSVTVSKEYVNKYTDDCYNRIDKKVALKMLDTLIVYSRELGDVKRRCMAYDLKVLCSMYTCDSKQQNKYFEEARRFISKTKYTKYLFHAWTCIVCKRVTDHKLVDALACMDDFQNEAVRLNDGYGLLLAYYNYGTIYYYMNMYKLAFDKFGKTARLKCDLSNPDNRNIMSEIYYYMASCSYYMNNDKNFLKYLQKSLDVKPDERSITTTIQSLCFYYLKKGDMPRFRQRKRQMDKLIKKYGTSQLSEYHSAMMATYYSKERNYTKALLYTDSIQQRDLKYRTKYDIYREAGQNKQADSILWKLVEYKENIIENDQAPYIRMLAKKYENVKTIYAKNQEITKIKLFTALSITILVLLTFAVYHILHNRNIRKLNVLREKAEDANRLKSLFLQNMSHEIRTPLNAIVGFTDLLNTDDADMDEGERKKILDIIHRNSGLLFTLINDILNLSHLESGLEKLVIKPVQIMPLCEKAIKSVEIRAKDGVHIYFKTPETAEEMSLILNTDTDRLSQILNNFLTNACKHTDKGEICLEYQVREDVVKFIVTDTGTGIPVESAEKIFERFEKLDQFSQGTGLGLNICKRLTILFHGNIYVDTSYTGGAKFVFEHPRNIEDLERSE